MAEHHIGTAVTVVATVLNEDEQLADPTTVAFTVKDPDGTETTPSSNNPSIGVYEIVFVPDASGTWRVLFEGQGAVTVQEEIPVLVAYSHFTP